MNGLLRDFLEAHAARLAELLSEEAAAAGGVDSSASRERVVRFVSAARQAVEGDLLSLQREYDLGTDAGGGIEDRLDACLHRLAALADAGIGLAGVEAPAAFVAEVYGMLGGVARRISVLTVAQLARQVSTSAHGPGSLSVTMHELRRPLTILSSYGQLLATGALGPLPEAANVAIEGISASTEMMVRMVNALAEVSRLEDPDDHLAIEDVHADDLVNGAVEQVGMEARLRDIEIKRDVAPDAIVQADHRRLVLALTNLVSNAVKHSPPKSEVMVRAWREGDDVHFTVTDHGQGYPPDEAPRLFEKYFRSVAERQRQIPGSGLGLYIVKTVADRHGGSVHSRICADGGAEFELTLPVRHPTEP